MTPPHGRACQNHHEAREREVWQQLYKMQQGEPHSAWVKRHAVKAWEHKGCLGIHAIFSLHPIGVERQTKSDDPGAPC